MRGGFHQREGRNPSGKRKVGTCAGSFFSLPPSLSSLPRQQRAKAGKKKKKRGFPYNILFFFRTDSFRGKRGREQKRERGGKGISRSAIALFNPKSPQSQALTRKKKGIERKKKVKKREKGEKMARRLGLPFPSPASLGFV